MGKVFVKTAEGVPFNVELEGRTFTETEVEVDGLTDEQLTALKADDRLAVREEE